MELAYYLFIYIFEAKDNQVASIYVIENFDYLHKKTQRK